VTVEFCSCGCLRGGGLPRRPVCKAEWSGDVMGKSPRRTGKTEKLDHILPPPKMPVFYDAKTGPPTECPAPPLAPAVQAGLHPVRGTVFLAWRWAPYPCCDPDDHGVARRRMTRWIGPQRPDVMGMPVRWIFADPPDP